MVALLTQAEPATGAQPDIVHFVISPAYPAPANPVPVSSHFTASLPKKPPVSLSVTVPVQLIAAGLESWAPLT